MSDAFESREEIEPREERDEPLDDSCDETARELRALYRRLQPPPLADGLDESDSETARAVGWMRGAWLTLEAPPLRAPARAQRSLRATRARRLAFAAAAGLVLATGALFLRSWTRERVEPARDVARLEPAPAPAGAAPAAEASATSANVARSNVAPSNTVEILDVRPDQVELRSGPVRLVLLSPPPARPAAVPSGS